MVATNVDEIRFEILENVAYVTIDRQHVLNAIDSPSHRRLANIWVQIESDPSVRAVVITGAGTRSFCAGADMSANSAGRTAVDYWAHLDPDGFGALSLRRSLDIPVIARVNGYAFGGGMEMMLGADIVIAAESATFSLSETRVGRVPLDGGIVELVRRIPHAQAMSILLTGRRFSAVELQRIGLVNEVVPMDQLDQSVQKWVDDIVACAPTSIRAIKQVVNRTEHLTARDAHGAKVPALIKSMESFNATEGVEAFKQKRKPRWKNE